MDDVTQAEDSTPEEMVQNAETSKPTLASKVIKIALLAGVIGFAGGWTYAHQEEYITAYESIVLGSTSPTCKMTKTTFAGGCSACPSTQMQVASSGCCSEKSSCCSSQQEQILAVAMQLDAVEAPRPNDYIVSASEELEITSEAL